MIHDYFSRITTSAKLSALRNLDQKQINMPPLLDVVVNKKRSTFFNKELETLFDPLIVTLRHFPS
jgi:hypothetical protein